jgi:DNA phosphorothioation-associated putative methyltransferase
MYLALSRFDGRPRFSQLPRDLQLDVRAFFSTYSRACDTADKLLFSAGDSRKVDEACRTSPVGKLTPAALYIHAPAPSP